MEDAEDGVDGNAWPGKLQEPRPETRLHSDPLITRRSALIPVMEVHLTIMEVHLTTHLITGDHGVEEAEASSEVEAEEDVEVDSSAT